MTPTITPAGKMVLYNVETGQAVERWPVDARAMVACGEYTADPLNGNLPAATVTPAPPSPTPDAPTEYAPGVPLVVTRSHDAPPSKPVELPTKATRGWKVRAGG